MCKMFSKEFWENWKFKATRIRSFLFVIRGQSLSKVSIFVKIKSFEATRIRSSLLVIREVFLYMFKVFKISIFGKIESSKRREFDLPSSLLGKCSKYLKFLFFGKLKVPNDQNSIFSLRY